MNRINQLFKNKSGNILSIYFTAGYPALNDTAGIIHSLVHAGTDMIEIGIPFSDPMADGPIIQQSSDKALKNGMSLKLLFNQLKDIRKEVTIPLLLMGYLNPVMQYGMERFCQECAITGIDGIILPDMPLEVTLDNSGILLNAHSNQNNHNIQDLFNHHNLHNIFLISPQTSENRIRKIDGISKGFIYMVSSSSTTGVKGRFTTEQTAYFKRIRSMKLENPTLIGFGVSNDEGFATSCRYARGAIIGSAFVKMLGERGFSESNIGEFVQGIKKKPAVSLD